MPEVSPRIHGIDGMRGYAAGVVLLHHLMFLDPWFLRAHLSAVAVMGGSAINELIYYTPLHIFIAGPEAVSVFFALSGAVLVQAYPGRKSLTIDYVLPRLARLYLPIFAAVALALTASSIRPQIGDALLSPWHANFEHVSQWIDILHNPGLLLRELAVLPGPSFLDSPLWSMRIEVIASARLFGIWFLGRLGAAGFVASAVIAFLFRRTPEVNWLTIQLPLFVGGAALALMPWRASRRQGNSLLALGVVAITLPFVGAGFGGGEWSRWAIPLTAIGAYCFTSVALGDSCVRSILTGDVARFLGARSYSLYLVHLPIVLTAGLWIVRLNAGQPNWWFWRLPLAALAFLTTEIFYRSVELPAHRFSRIMRRRLIAARA
ncbi:MAG: acyltransferase family protein [Candidatus Nanopelagicales bacterium]